MRVCMPWKLSISTYISLVPRPSPGPQRSGSPAHAQPRVEPAIYPSRLPFISYCTTVRLDRAFTNVLRPVVRMRTTQVPHRRRQAQGAPRAPRPPHVMFLTRPSRGIPELSNFYCVLRCARAGEGLGTRLHLYSKGRVSMDWVT